MTEPLLGIALPLAALYALFLAWYGGKGQALSQAETDRFLHELGSRSHDTQSQALLADVRQLVAKDDGREFVMQNLVHYRPKALYPAGHQFGDDPRTADQRYGKAIIWPLLRYGNHPIFIARRSGRFIEPDGTTPWHYVAMVRYRSRRDFLRFALMIERHNIAMHKWAAIESTLVFPVRPLVSLIMVRAFVAMALTLLGLSIHLATA